MMRSQKRPLSQLAQTNLGRQIAGRLHRRSQAPLQTGRRVKEGYGATRQSSLVWPGQPASETTSEFPVEDDGLERLRRLRDALAQRQTDADAPAPPAQPERGIAARPGPARSRSSGSAPAHRPTQPASSTGSAGSVQRSSNERPTPATTPPPRRRAIVEELTPESVSRAATSKDSPVQRKDAATERRESSRRPVPPQQACRHNDETPAESPAEETPAIPATSDTLQRKPDRTPVETQEANAEQSADVSHGMDTMSVQPARERSPEAMRRPDESVRSQQGAVQREHAAPEEQGPASRPPPAPERQRRTDSVSQSPVHDTAPSPPANEPTATRRAEPPPVPNRPTAVATSDTQSAPPARDQVETQQATTAPTEVTEANVRRQPATDEQPTPTVNDTPPTRYQPTSPQPVGPADPSAEQRTGVERHGRTPAHSTRAQASGSESPAHRMPEDRTAQTVSTELNDEPASPGPTPQTRTHPNLPTTAVQRVQRRQEQADPTPADHTQHSTAQIDAGSAPPARELPADAPPRRVDAEILLAMAADAQERRTPTRQPTRREREKQPAPRVQRKEASIQVPRTNAPELDPKEHSTVVQRAPVEEDAAAVRPEPAAEPETETPPTEDTADYDIDAMARDVYQILRRRLRVERERTRGWR